VVQDRLSPAGVQFEKDFLKFHTDAVMRNKMADSHLDDGGSDEESTGDGVQHAYNHLEEMCNKVNDDDSDCDDDMDLIGHAVAL
jgi:hypothetical protein